MSIDTTTFPARDRLNDRMVMEVRYTGPAAYAAGGDAISPTNDLGFSEVYGVYGTINNGSATLLTHWNYATQKLQFWVPATGAEASGNLSGYSGTLLFTGRG